MPKKENIIEVFGTVLELLPGSRFSVNVEKINLKIIAYPSGKIRLNNIKILVGDRVKLELSPYDLTVGRIVFREK